MCNTNVRPSPIRNVEKRNQFYTNFLHFGRFLKKNYLVIKKNIYIRSTNQHYYTINRLLEKEKADRFFFIKSTACTTIWF